MRFQVEGLGVHGPGGPIVRGVSFGLDAGMAACIVGETGAGKSLVAEALFGLLGPGLQAEGRLELPDGRGYDLSDAAGLRGIWGRWLFLLPQEPRAALDPTARLLGQVAEALPVAGRRAAAAGLLARFGLGVAAGRAIPAALSGGMAQRGLVAVGAAVEAPLLVVDEPTKGLDGPRVAEVVRSLIGLRAAGRALLVVTHDLTLPGALDAELLVLHGGAMVERGRASTVLSRPVHGWTRTLVAAAPSNWPRRGAAARRAGRLIEAEGIAFAWPGMARLFEGVSLLVQPGRVLGVSGASGAGKSTLCDVLMGLRRPSSGLVRWQGVDLAGLTRRRRRAEQRRWQKLYQDPGASFPPHRRLRAVFADLAAVTERPLERLGPLMERLGVRADTLERRVGQVSGGEAQRLALARALLLRPAVLFADEPTSRLDASTQAALAGLLRELVEREGLAVVWVSHDAALLQAVSDDQVVALGGGAGV